MLCVRDTFSSGLGGPPEDLHLLLSSNLSEFEESLWRRKMI